MPITINSRILLSVASIAAAAALLIGATFAFFSDNETSQNNVFTAGSLDLKVDSESHYAGLTCTNDVWVEDQTGQSTRPDLIGDPCDGTWSQTDLGPQHKFFNLSDLKPGDNGENTISLHVIDNDAWGRLVINDVQDLENTFLEAELDSGNDPDGVTSGELRETLLFSIWLDDGATPGFQGKGNDAGEGNNIQDEGELTLVSQGTVDEGGETHNIWLGLQAAYTEANCDNPTPCPGLMSDGRLVESTTYYFGIDWELPSSVGNEVQTDSLGADMTIEVVQHRNNTSQTF